MTPPTQVSNMLVPSEGPQEQVTVSDAMLLSFYEAINLNRNFITVLTHVSIEGAWLVGVGLGCGLWDILNYPRLSVGLASMERAGSLIVVASWSVVTVLC